MTRTQDFTVPGRCKEVWFGGRMAKGLMQNARQYGLQWQGANNQVAAGWHSERLTLGLLFYGFVRSDFAIAYVDDAVRVLRDVIFMGN